MRTHSDYLAPHDANALSPQWRADWGHAPPSTARTGRDNHSPLISRSSSISFCAFFSMSRADAPPTGRVAERRLLAPTEFSGCRRADGPAPIAQLQGAGAHAQVAQARRTQMQRAAYQRQAQTAR